MLRRLPLAVWITLVWIALWGDLSWGNLLAGGLVAVAVLAAVPLSMTGASVRVAPGPALRYAAVFGRDLCIASVEVARQVFWPIDRLRPAVVAVPMASSDPRLLALVADTITLTPGTLTLEADAEQSMLWIHVLHLAEGGEGRVVADAQALERLGARVLRLPDGAGPGGAS